jgi:hypothetical protein
MKKQLILISILSVCLILSFLIMSCAPGPQNSNTASNAGNAPVNVTISTPCTDDDIDKEMKKIIKGTGIENQYNGNLNPNRIRYFDYRLVMDGDKKVLLIQGGISDGSQTNQGGNAEFMEKMIRSVDQLVKRNCVFKAAFVKYGTFKKLDKGELMLRDIEGFEWSICEWPKIACPDGQCLDSCPGMEMTTTNTAANANANVNANSRVNANGNVNANANGSSNAKNANRAP